MQEFWDDYVGGHYDFDKEIKQMKDYLKYFRKNFIPLLPKDKNSRVLEIGFGNGFFLKTMMNAGYNNFLGIEPGKTQYEFTKKHITDKVLLVADTFKFLSKNKNRFDAIVMIEVLEHIPKKDTNKLLSLIKDSLKENGIIIIKVPNMSNPLMLRSRYSDFTHEVGFTPESLFQVLHCADFKIIRVFPDSLAFSFKGTIAWFAQKICGFPLKLLGKIFLINIILSKSLIATARKPQKEPPTTSK
ncbi:class I SAM-dependent methyltransferase [Candidatus Pacearchaeota archaeon]|nr:class I SAM-dependent methyltransferase [Candidatus Pacearchaeota archaeon]